MAAHFYFTDAKTMNKMQASKPGYISLEFKPDVHHSIIDYVVTIGGDGTILYAVKEFKERVPPLITFQRGSLGFMCRFSLDQIEETLRKLVHYHQ
jgi:NAD kinase